MKNHLFDSLGRYTISAYDRQKPFSSFLPGIAGLEGIPMWVFYTNRGQAVTSFGVENKDGAIMEFQPANKAYQFTPYTGFRTFIKEGHSESLRLYEPFSPAVGTKSVPREMRIGLNEFTIREENSQEGMEIQVLYFTLPGEPFAAFIRQVNLTNISNRSMDLEVLDGMPAVVPYGADNGALKHIGRTIEAWMEVANLEHKIPFFRLRSSAGDSAEVSSIQAGHFALSFAVQRTQNPQVLAPLVDPQLVFGQDTSLTYPNNFSCTPLQELTAKRQITSGKTPCAFFGANTSLPPGESLEIHTVIGHVKDIQDLEHAAKKIYQSGYLFGKRQEAALIAKDLTTAVETSTSSPVLDGYTSQTFVDNLLRGGWPISLGNPDQPKVFHVYGRKHGDPERDYNDFYLAAQPYSQGNGNYRDVNQNRRNDVFFHPEAGLENIRLFMSLIQADGYNPLVVNGLTFRLPQGRREEILNQLAESVAGLSLLEGDFTPGELLTRINARALTAGEADQPVPETDLLNLILGNAEADLQASYGEGYWVDHWTYNLDLIENYLAVFPERQESLLFGMDDLPFFESPAVVQPRRRKYVLSDVGPRQYGAVKIDKEKASRIAARNVGPNWMRAGKGNGSIYHASLITKLVLLAVIKFASLDPEGMGIEMEAGKPGWYDALNGLPGLFGSSMPESYELKRLLNFLIEIVNDKTAAVIQLPIEGRDLLDAVKLRFAEFERTANPQRDLRYWEAVSSAREDYRERIRFGFDGETVDLEFGELAGVLADFQRKLNQGILKAERIGQGLPVTYFRYEITGYEHELTPNGSVQTDDQGRPYIRPLGFRPIPLPPFLEGPVHALKLVEDVSKARRLYRQVKDSPLYDHKLKMYKVNAPLDDQSYEIGRARAFTPGWLENESIWLHMEYKYLLETLKAGLYEEFSDDFRNALIPFQDPEVYGRSILENSSFLASSAHPDESLHGTGFVARLSGATAEYLSIWQRMMFGPQPFSVEYGELCLRFQPALAGWLFDDSGHVSARFLNRCRITYVNPQRRDTYAKQMHIEKMVLNPGSNQPVEISGNRIGSPFAQAVRQGEVEEIKVYYAYIN